MHVLYGDRPGESNLLYGLNAHAGMRGCSVAARRLLGGRQAGACALHLVCLPY